MINTPSDALLGTAFSLASELHAGQLRKGTTIPYLSHLMSVSALVIEDGGTQTEAAGALLHDAAEDQGGWETLNMIVERCGPEVAALVEECSDSLLDAGEKKAPWRERKLAMIASMPTKSRGALLIIAADKLHNTRSTAIDLTLVGPSVWDRFKTGSEGFLWYHESLVVELKKLIPTSRSVAQLTSELAALTTSANLRD